MWNFYQFRRLLRNIWFGIPWETFAHIATLLSVIVAGRALYISNYQFKESIQKTQEQIDFMRAERKRNMAENRPYLVIDSAIVDGESKLPDEEKSTYSTYSMVINNIGNRPATEIMIYNKVVGINIREDNKIDPFSCKAVVEDSISFSNPEPKGSKLKYFAIPDHQKFNKLYFKTVFKYSDKLMDTTYLETYYFSHSKVDFTDIPNYWSDFFDQQVPAKDVKIIDSLIKIKFPMKK